jgi:hypothetical protein
VRAKFWRALGTSEKMNLEKPSQENPEPQGTRGQPMSVAVTHIHNHLQQVLILKRYQPLQVMAQPISNAKNRVRK